MALTRKLLVAMGIEGEKIDEIINAHAETVDALKGERDDAKKQAETAKSEADKAKADSAKLADVQKELDELKKSQGGNIFEERYNTLKQEKDDLQAEFDKYKNDIKAGEAKRAKESAYRKLLLDSNVSDKRIDSILKVTDTESLELTEDGTFKNEADLKKSIGEEWADFIVEKQTVGANVANPANNNGGGSTKPKSRAAQIAAQYHAELYGENKEA